MGDTSLVFALSTRNDTADGMRDARQTVQQESEAMAADVGQGGAGAAARFGEALKAGAAAAMVGVGIIVAQGFAEALDQSRIAGRLAAQLGKTPAEAERYGKIAGDLYADAITEDFQTAANTIQGVMRTGLLPPDATNEQIKSISTRLADVANVMEEDVGQAARTVGKMIKTGLAQDADEALDILTRGVQTGANEAQDLLDTFSEYSTQFRNMGLSGQEAMGLISQGLKGGARDADVVADTIKEFSIEAVKGADGIAKGYERLGLDADTMFDAFREGGGATVKALDETFDKLRAVEDPVERNAIAFDLFGTKAEDMGDALFALDPSEAVSALGDVGGAADKMGDALRDNAGTRVEAFKRSLQQGLVDFLGGTVIPALDDFKERVGKVFGGLWDEAGKNNTKGADRIIGFFSLLGQRLADKAAELAPKAIEALIGFGQKVADYIVANPEQVLKLSAIAAAIVAAIATLPLMVAGALASAATLMMVGFTQKLISTLNEKLPEWWDSFTGWVGEKASQAPGVFHVVGAAIGRWFGGLWSRYVSGPVGRQWESFITTVQGLPGRAVSALSTLGDRLASVSSTAWQRFKGAAAAKAADFIGWVGRLPGRISSGIGWLGGLLYNKGRDVVIGLWNGISSLGGWLWSQVKNFVSRNIVDAAASLLQLGSPSRLMADEIGHWIPPGIAQGAEDNRRVLDDTMQDLVNPTRVRPAGRPPTRVAPLAGGAPGGGQILVRVVFDGPKEMTRLVREIVADVGGGSVQKAFGST